MSETIKFHPLADIFPLMEGAEFDELVADIKANGQHARIILKDGMILDGRNRYRACLALGIEPSFACEAYSDQITDPLAYVIGANIRRRHLNAEQKHQALVELVKASPEKSDRTLAKEAGTAHTTVARARKRAEATGAVAPVEKRTGADGKARKQPAKKKTAPVKPKPISSQVQRELDAKQAHIDEPEIAREHDKDLAEKLRAAEIKIAGLESEVEELKAENARLRAELEAKQGPAAEKQVEPAVPKKRGRPPGSKNKAKPAVAAAADPTPVENVPGAADADPGLMPDGLRRVR
jgi:hypothetical protein